MGAEVKTAFSWFVFGGEAKLFAKAVVSFFVVFLLSLELIE